MKSSKTPVGDYFDLQGHRGCRGLMPENTIPAMLKAIDLHANTLEMDAVITKDNKVIISHEPFFNHEITTKPNGDTVTNSEEKSLNIYRMTYHEVQQFDVGLKLHPRFKNQQKLKATKPLLSDLIDGTEAYTSSKNLTPVFYNIETKTTSATDDIYHPKPNVFVDLLISVIESKGIKDRVIIQSFDIRTLQYLHSKFPSYKTALLIEDFDKRNLEIHLKELTFNPTIYSPEGSLVSKDLLNSCHQKGIKIIPWTVNDLAQMKALKELGVDGIISDYPNLYSQL